MFRTVLIAVFVALLSCAANAQIPNAITNGVPNTAPAFVNSVNVQNYGVSASASDNATALQNAINAAVTNGQALYIPSASSCYKYTAPLTISGNLTIIGDWVGENWNGNINAPAGSPALSGSVLCPSSNGSDAIDISASTTSAHVDFQNIGILFQTPMSGTGDAIHYIPSSTNQGLSGSKISNVKIFGVDGNHYAFNLQNPIYDVFDKIYLYGGGAFRLVGNGAAGHNYGNSTFSGLFIQLTVGGTADAVNISSNALNNLNFLYFINPEIDMDNDPNTNITPAANPPTNAQYLWRMDTNTTYVSAYCPGWGGNVASLQALLNAGNNSNWTFNCANMGNTVNAPAWTTKGIAVPAGNPMSFNDTTSTGTVAVAGTSAMPSSTITASNAVTFTDYASLYVPTVTCSTNVTCTTPEAIYAAGTVKISGGNLTISNASGGALFATGNAQINLNASTRTTEIGDGTTSGAVTIGGSSNTTNLNSATITVTNLATDATHTDRTVCQDTTSKSIFFGSGTAGVCLGTSSARFKHNIADLGDGLQQIMGLRPVTYEYNADHGDPNKTLYGFTAEDMEKVLPQLVGMDSQGKPNSADYLGVVPVLVKGMQQQQKEIEQLKAANDNRWCIWKLCFGS